MWSGVRDGALALGTVDSYVIARLTGGAAHVTDPSNASRTLLYDLEKGAWSDELCDLFDVPRSALPEVVPSSGVIGTTDPDAFLGLSLPIAGIAGDQQAALFGQACYSPGMSKCTYGTGSFVLTNTGSAPVRSDAGLLTTVAWDLGDGPVYALEGAIFVTGAAVQWLRDGLGLIDSAAEIEGLARTVPDSGDVVFVPALTGLGAPDWDPHARGRSSASRGDHPRAHRPGDPGGDRVRGARRRRRDGRRGGAGGPGAVGRRRRQRQRPADAAAGRPARRARSAARWSPRRRRSARPSSPVSVPACGGRPTSWRRPGRSDRRFEPEAGRRDDGRHDRWRDAVRRAGGWTS